MHFGVDWGYFVQVQPENLQKYQKNAFLAKNSRNQWVKKMRFFPSVLGRVLVTLTAQATKFLQKAKIVSGGAIGCPCLSYFYLLCFFFALNVSDSTCQCFSIKKFHTLSEGDMFKLKVYLLLEMLLMVSIGILNDIYNLFLEY